MSSLIIAVTTWLLLLQLQLLHYRQLLVFFKALHPLLEHFLVFGLHLFLNFLLKLGFCLLIDLIGQCLGQLLLYCLSQFFSYFVCKAKRELISQRVCKRGMKLLLNFLRLFLKFVVIYALNDLFVLVDLTVELLVMFFSKEQQVVILSALKFLLVGQQLLMDFALNRIVFLTWLPWCSVRPFLFW